MPRRKQIRSTQPGEKAASVAQRSALGVADGAAATLISGPLSPAKADCPRGWIAALVLIVSIGAVYGPALDVPFIVDDKTTIVTNTSITSLWPLVGAEDHRGPLNPEPQIPSAGRPLVNFSFAVNYYFGRVDPLAYHAVNAVIHFLSAVLLWAISRRTLRLPYFGDRFAKSASWLALAIAILWALHPLQTEAVIYATQRTELMYAFFYLATLYCSLRYWALRPRPSEEGQGQGESDACRPMRMQRAAWLLLAVTACLAGMASKEMMVSAPLIVLLFERTFIAGSLARSLRRSWPLYAGLAATWILLLALNIHGPRNASAGFNLGVTGYSWWLTQTKVWWIYLKLVVWPWPLLFHYQFEYFNTFVEAWLYAAPALLLGLLILVLLWRNNPVGFLGACVIAILSPTLIVPIVTEMAAERRMYLPLAALASLAVVCGYWLVKTAFAGRIAGSPMSFGSNLRRAAAVLPVLFLAIVFGLVSVRRLTAYRDVTILWRQVLAAYPEDSLAQFNQGTWLLDRGRLPEAVEAFKVALKYDPKDSDAASNLAVALMRLGRFPEGIEYARRAVELQPEATDAHINLGLLLRRSDRLPEAIAEFQAALALNPDDAIALDGLGVSLLLSQRSQEASDVLEHAVQLAPDNAELHDHFGRALVRAGKAPEGIEHFQAAVRLQPNFVEAYVGLVGTLAKMERFEEAIATAEKAKQIAGSAGRQDIVDQMDEFLKSHQAGLRRATMWNPLPKSPRL